VDSVCAIKVRTPERVVSPLKVHKAPANDRARTRLQVAAKDKGIGAIEVATPNRFVRSLKKHVVGRYERGRIRGQIRPKNNPLGPIQFNPPNPVVSTLKEHIFAGNKWCSIGFVTGQIDTIATG
jgi:hypothetical protein